MPCIICSPSEDESDVVTVCARCTIALAGMERSQIRELIDRLYLADQTERAEFLEQLVFKHVGNANTTLTLKRRVK